MSSSHYVCGEFVVATNGLILLENVEEHIHFQQIFADTAMGGGALVGAAIFPT